MTQAPETKPKPPLAVKFFAVVKLLKGIALAGIALGLFRLAHRDLDQAAEDFITFLKVSPENRYARLLLEKAGLVQPGQVMRAGIATSVYSSILLLEGLGLWFGASWAEYLVVLSTGLFVPEEIRACLRGFTWTKFTILTVNAVILIYFIRVLWLKHLERRLAAIAAKDVPPAQT
jgi:uncharacterized membrane protein (DUF2068 family)